MSNCRLFLVFFAFHLLSHRRPSQGQDNVNWQPRVRVDHECCLSLNCVASCLRGVRQFLQAIELATLFGYFRTTLYLCLFACKFGVSFSYNFVLSFICMQVCTFILLQLCTFVYLHASLDFHFRYNFVPLFICMQVWTFIFGTTLYLCLFACKFVLLFCYNFVPLYFHTSLHFIFEVTTLQ
jgi:hypothetical protein